MRNKKKVRSAVICSETHRKKAETEKIIIPKRFGFQKNTFLESKYLILNQISKALTSIY